MQRAWSWMFSPMPCFYDFEHCLHRYIPHDHGEQQSQYSTVRFLLKEVKKVKERPARENLKANDKIKIKAFNNTKEKLLQLLFPFTPQLPLLRPPVPQPAMLYLVTTAARCPCVPHVLHPKCCEQHVQPVEHVTEVRPPRRYSSKSY